MSNSQRTSRDRRYDTLVLDLDNTVYDWTSYYAGTLQAMIDVLVGPLEITRDDLIAQFRDVYARKGSVEYAFVVQELEATGEMSRSKVAKLIDSAQRAFAEARRRLLCPYAGVEQTLAHARARGVVIIAVTNAPLFQAHRRLRQLGLVRHFDALAAWEGFEIPKRDPFVGEIRERSRRGDYAPTVPTFFSFKRRSLKPRNEMFRWAMEVTRSTPERTIAVGDSIEKDVVPAMSLGAAGAWSAYGARPQDDHFELLLKVTPWQKREIAKTYSEVNPANCVTLEDFSELVEVLGLDTRKSVSMLRGSQAGRVVAGTRSRESA